MGVRKALSITCGVCFFGATLYSICNSVTLGSILSFTSGTAFFLGTIMDHRDIFRRVEANQKPRDSGINAES